MPSWSLDSRTRALWSYRVGRGVRAAYTATRKAVRDRVVRSSGSFGDLWNEQLWIVAVDRSIVPVLDLLYHEVTFDVADAVGIRDALGDRFLTARADQAIRDRLPIIYAVGDTIGDRVETVAEAARQQDRPPGWVLRELGLENDSTSFAAGPMSTGLMERVVRTETTAGIGVASVLAVDVLDDEDLLDDADVEAGESTAGLVGTKTWRCQFINSRDSHINADGQTVLAGGMFSINGWAGAFPGDPELPPAETINCLCSLDISVVAGRVEGE